MISNQLPAITLIEVILWMRWIFWTYTTLVIKATISIYWIDSMSEIWRTDQSEVGIRTWTINFFLAGGRNSYFDGITFGWTWSCLRWKVLLSNCCIKLKLLKLTWSQRKHNTWTDYSREENTSLHCYWFLLRTTYHK